MNKHWESHACPPSNIISETAEYRIPMTLGIEGQN
jgi:hypothetical protein